MNPRFQTDKRTSSGLDLADHLTFRLRRGSRAFTLNLERNHDINPDTDMYFLRNVRNGRFRIVKSRNLEKENLAYYQDKDNEASIIVRCVKRSSEYCDRVISPATLHIHELRQICRKQCGEIMHAFFLA
ncbi:hypothetical protein CHS0354_040626 [Potamilus streckersoni]|uniref:Uncharacterized protein n=1 Tax=Potamilus streckersoni TaxID=2493646 RepID=A0AAE0SGN9_9BIVA|nr:hypothetical protein CHS0354_040626 [Potamilus streckersoni]